MELDHRIVPYDHKMLHNEFGAISEHFAEFGESSSDEVGLRFVRAGKRMGSHYGPVNVIGDVLEKAGSIALLQTFEN
jgi:hypothetical protein